LIPYSIQDNGLQSGKASFYFHFLNILCCQIADRRWLEPGWIESVQDFVLQCWETRAYRRVRIGGWRGQCRRWWLWNCSLAIACRPTLPRVGGGARA